MLKSEWSPAWTLMSVCMAIVMLLANPEPDSPFNCDCANLLRNNDKKGYESLVKMYVKMNADPSLK